MKKLKQIIREEIRILKEQDDPSFIPYVGSIDTWNLKNMYIKNRTADGILTNAEKEFMKKPDVVVITANRFNTIWTDGKQEFQINIKTNKLVKPLRKARKEIVNHFKNLKYRWQGDTLIFEAKWSDFKHTKGFVHIPLGIKTELSNSDRKKITVLTDLELNKNKSFQERFHYFSIYIKEGSLWMSVSPSGKRFIQKRMKEDKNYLRELIDRIKKAIVRGKLNEGRRRKESINEANEGMESGLMVYPSTPRDKAKIQKWLDSSDYYGEWAREGYFLFPEKRSSYDSLEDELGREFLKHKINVRFEGV